METKEQEEVTLCIKCKWYNNLDTYNCMSPKAPYTDFVVASKSTNLLNAYGNCKYYEPK